MSLWKRYVRKDEVQVIALARASLCVSCLAISNVHGPSCPACGESALVGLARLLNPSPEQGYVKYLRVG